MAGEKHLYLVAKGAFTGSGATPETWQVGIRLWADVSVPADEGTLPNTGDYGADTATLSDAGVNYDSDWKWTVGIGTVIVPIDYLHDQAVPAFVDFWAAPLVSQRSALESLTLYPMDATGHVFEARKATATFVTPVAGGRGTDIVPTELSVVCSWNTSRPGRRGRGRIYLPATSVSGIGANGLVQGTMQGDTLTAAIALLEGLAVEGVGPTTTHVRPIVTGKPWTSYAVINSVNVGDVFDAQRRRRRSLVEGRVSGDVTYG